MAHASICCLAVAAVLVAGSAAVAQDDDGGSLDDVPHVTIIGTAQAELAPDLATITLGVTNEKPNASAAADANARATQTVFDAAKAQGVAPADIATQSVTLTQTFDEIRDTQGQSVGQKPRGFAAENIVAIRIRDLAKVGAIAETLIQKGANRFDGIAFSLEHPEPVLARLTGEAVKNARTQAQIAAEAAGVRLGRVLLIERPGGGDDRPVPLARFAMKVAAAPAMQVVPGTTTLSQTIEVTWALDAN